MKKNFTILFAIFLLFTLSKTKAQNIVPNPGFENYASCSLTYGEVYKCQNWSSFGYSPDYFNACSPDSIVNVPKNNFGFQYASGGIAYCGFINTSGGPAPPPEYIGAELTQPLVAGQKYYASLNVSFSGNSCGSNKMGIGLSTVAYDQSNPPPLNNNAVVYTDSVIKDTAGWVQIKGSFIADSNYTYIIIGNFFTNVNVCPAGTYVSYYFVDDVCISSDSTTCYSSLGMPQIKNSETVILYPNPFSNELNIHITTNELLEITLYDFTSRKVLTKCFENSTSLNIEQLAYGMYIYELKNKNGTIKKGKLIKD